MEQQALISVILPVYNMEAYVERCVESLCRQTYRNLEIILVDDGSTDHSGAICDALAKADSRIRAFHKANGGVSSARNWGLQHARGDYIGFCDPDDAVHRDMYRLLFEALEETNSQCAVCSFAVFSDAAVISLGEPLPEEAPRVLTEAEIIT